MRVTLVNSFYHPWRGGEEVHCKNLAEGLVSRGHEVDVYCSSLPLPPGDRVTNGVRVHGHRTLGLFFGVPICPSLFFSLVRSRGDVIQVEFPNPAFALAAGFAGKLTRRPVVLTYHNDLPAVTPLAGLLAYIHDLLALAYFKSFSALVATTSVYPKGSRVLSRLQYVVIRNGVDVKKFRPGRRADYFLFVAAMGRWHRYKGLDVLLDAYKLYLQAGGRRPLYVVGEGSQRPSYEAKAESLGLKSVKFLGDVPDEFLPQVYSSAYAYVSASVDRSEGFGLTVLEAMASGLPVIATNVGGLPELVKDGVNGFLVSPRDPRSLADAMVRLDDEGVAAQMGLRGREMAERMTWDAMVSSYEQLYSTLIGVSREG
ncbi:glycosyltransferase family 4 protein [Tardisphaera miroshnichenkoae]